MYRFEYNFIGEAERQGVAPPPLEACASGQGVPGVACWARRGIAANRLRRGAAVAVRGVALPPWAMRAIPAPAQGVRRIRATRGAAEIAAVACRSWRTVFPLIIKQLVGRQAPVSHRVVGCRHPVWHRRQPGKAWRRSRQAKRSAAAVGRGVPSMPRDPAAVPGVRCRVRRGVAATRPCRVCSCSRGARRAIHATAQGVPLCRGVLPPAHSLSAHYQTTGRPRSPDG